MSARTLLPLLAAAGCSSPPAAPKPAPPADLILVGGAIETMDPGRPRAEALAIRGGAVAFVGDRAGALALRGGATRVVELGGAMVLPGFHDAHVHPVTGGIELGQCDLNDVDSVAAIRERVKGFAARNPDAAWIVGGGWSLPLFGAAGPTAAMLDELVGDRPAYITASDAHSAWVNTRALAIAQITAATKDPPAGRIERDADGAPTGTLRESAMDLVAKHLPPLSHADHVAGLRRGMAMANSFGITSVLEASADAGVLAAYDELSRRGELTFRVVAAQKVDLARGTEQVAAMAARRGGPRFRPIAAKIFVDGVIEAGTAALLEPYIGRPGNGALNIDAENLSAMIAALDRAGLDVHMHAIGDRAIRAALDGIEAAIAANPARDRRHSIAHLQLIDPADIERFAKLGVVADFQPLWAYADRYITELTEPFLGPKRSRWLYPIKSVVDTGAVVAAGSDWSVSSMNPLRGIQVAVTRTAIGKKGAPWIPAERIDLETALIAYTRAGAYLLRQDDQVGTLSPGKRADLVILSRDLTAIPASEIAAVKVLATLVDGEVVYGRLGPVERCSFDAEPRVIKREGAAVLQVWEVDDREVLHRPVLPDDPGLRAYRDAIEAAGAAVEQPPLLRTTSAPGDVWDREEHNARASYSGEAGALRPIQCLEALLFAAQNARYSELDHPTELIASILRKGKRLRVYYGGSDQMFPAKSVYGLDEARRDVADGWAFVAVLHNHTVQQVGGRLALGVPTLSTADVDLTRSLVADTGLASARVTNGFYTIEVPATALDRYRGRAR